MTHRSPITLLKLARAAVAGIPETPEVMRGVATLLRARFSGHASLGLVLEERARRTPDAPALLFGDRRWSYAEFNAWANRYAAAFRRAGVTSGTTVALLMENHAAGLACVAALAKLGASAGLLNPGLRGEALRHSIGTMRPAQVVVAGECIEAYRDASPGPEPTWWLEGHADLACPHGWRDLDAEAAGESGDNPASTPRVETRQTLCYILTSGTTGMPKASRMSHQRWLKVMGGLGQAALRLTPDDVLYCALPLYHNNALTVSWGAALGGGAALALDRKFSASRFWDRVRHYQATSFTYIGELCRYLLAQPESPDDREHRVRACIGNGLRPDLWATFKRRFGIERICEFYGASEGNLAFVNGFNMEETAGFCPYSYAIVECDLDTAQPRRGPDQRLAKVERGGIGLLMTEVTDSAPFDGYTDAAAGDSKLVRNAFTDGDCWFNTGDLVRDQGWKHIQFVDRLGDTFRWKGENVATTEVEAALRELPWIADSAVYGVQVPGADGRAGMAAVRIADGAALDGEALARHLCARLPAYAVPLFLRQVGSLETTATFKTRKQGLKEQGFDATRVTDPLFMLRADRSGYDRLGPDTLDRLRAGTLKL